MGKIFFCIFLSIVLLYSCAKENSSDEDNIPEKTTKLNVPSNFDWKTSTNISCDFTAQHNTKVYVALSNEAEPFASFIVGAENDQVFLNVPTFTEKLYVSYEINNGSTKTEVLTLSGTTLKYTLPNDSKEYIEPQTQSFSAYMGQARASHQNVGTIFFPSTSEGWGTIMFEDLWPGYGDYDFNDLVVNYKIQLYLQNKNKVEGMLIGIQVKAIGGSIPNDFYLTLTGVKGGEIEEITPYNSFNAVAGTTMEHLNPGDNVHTPATFLFKSIRENPKKPQGSIYLNTEKGQEMADQDLVSVSYFVQFRNAVKIADVTFDKFDFFIANKDKEIHLGGFTPSLLGESVYNNFANNSNNVSQDGKYYYSKDNLIWGLSIPANVPHAYESTDFLKAYPKFAKWAQSGGYYNKDWYKDYNRVNANLVK